MYTSDEKLKAAYALNLCTVSVSQIVDYNDINVLEQEYENILNNLNLEQIPKDEPLLDILTKILDTVTFYKIKEGDKNMIEAEYQHKMKNAVWSAIPSLGMIFATSNPLAMAVTLATQVGIGYMNYRRNKAEYQLGWDKEYWQLQRAAIEQLNGLQKELFTTAWRLAREYDFPDEFRLTEKQIHEYNEILMEQNPIKRYNRLDSVQRQFSAYPQFWYQMGSAANSIYRSDDTRLGAEIKHEYKNHAIDCFEKYRQLNKFNILRCDILTSSWALEYIDILDLNKAEDKAKAEELVAIAEKHAGNAKDVLELCAYAQLKLGDYENAARLFNILVNADYNADINARILSGLYIQKSRNEETRDEALADYQKLSTITDQSYLLPMPKPDENWTPEWTDGETNQENAAPDLSAFEEITISKLHIGQGENVIYKNKIIHFRTMLKCEGALEFDSCVLHYNETERANEINLTNTASLAMRKCTIINHGYNKRVFLNAEENEKEIKLENCEFINCSWFLTSRGDLWLEQCKMVDIGEKFITQLRHGNRKASITKCEFLFQQRPVFFPEKDNSDVISCNVAEISQCVAKGQMQISSTSIAVEKIEKNSSYRSYSFWNISGGTIKNCSFYGIDNIFSVGSYDSNVTISLSSFRHCFNIINASYGPAIIEDCRFEYCTKVGTNLKKNSQIIACQFNDCFCELIGTGFDGGISISSCEFNNWEQKSTEDLVCYQVGFFDPPMLNFKRTKKGGQRSTITQCVFNGMSAHQSFLIAGDIFEKIDGTVVSVEKCSFENCTTDRNSGKIIKEYAHYFTVLKAQKELKVVSILDCSGLDKINHGNGYNDTVIVRRKNSVGATIGVAVSAVVAGVPGYIAAKAIENACTDDEVHAE